MSQECSKEQIKIDRGWSSAQRWFGQKRFVKLSIWNIGEPGRGLTGPLKTRKSRHLQRRARGFAPVCQMMFHTIIRCRRPRQHWRKNGQPTDPQGLDSLSFHAIYSPGMMMHPHPLGSFRTLANIVMMVSSTVYCRLDGRDYRIRGNSWKGLIWREENG